MMETDFSVLGRVSLFQGITGEALSGMLRCLNAETAQVKKNAILLLAGDPPRHVCVVLEGRVHIVREDRDGNRTLVSALQPGDIFQEALCCAGVAYSPVTVVAETEARIMRLQLQRILHTCPTGCAFHGKLIENMLALIARKNLMLQNRMEMLTLHSVREKVLFYLGSFEKNRGEPIHIPFNRERMAEYLCVERSALSHALSSMKRDGLIDYSKNVFILK